VKENELANPGALGLGGFALTTFLLSIINAGVITPESIGMVLPMAFFYGGLAQILAGMWEFKTGNIFGATCFSSFGAFWLGLALMVILEKTGVIATVPPAGLAVFLFCLGFIYPLRHCSRRKSTQGTFYSFYITNHNLLLTCRW
jgi:succinate-acetate transporter protein